MNVNYIVGIIHGKEQERNILAQKYADAKEEIENTFTPEYCATSNKVIKNRIFTIMDKHFGEEISRKKIESAVEEEMRLPNMICREALEKKKQEDECKAEDCRSLKDIKELLERKAKTLDGVPIKDGGGACIGIYFSIANDLPPVTPKSDKPLIKCNICKYFTKMEGCLNDRCERFNDTTHPYCYCFWGKEKGADRWE